MKTSLTLSVLVYFISVFSFGQNVQCDCSAALDASLKDKYSEIQMQDLRIELYEYYQHLQNKEQNGSSNFTLSSAGEAFTNYGIFGGDMDVENKSHYNKMLNLEKIIQKEQSISEEVFKQIVTDVFSDNQLSAYQSCLDACDSQSGVFYQVTGDLEDVFGVTINFRNNLGKELVTIKNISMINCDPVGGLVLKREESILNNRSITQYFRVADKNKPCQLAIDFYDLAFPPIDFGDGYRSSHSNAPIGTIVSSVLDYNSFVELNKFKVTNKMSEAIWVPCDGRNVKASKYGEFVGNVPDLRGVFLRGVNEYGVDFPGVSLVNATQANPDNVQAGVFQSDSFKAHNHNLGDAGKADWDGKVGENRQRVTNSGGNGIVTSVVGGNETRPKNITVYYYIKIN